MGMTILVAIVHIGTAVIIDVLAGSFYSVAESLSMKLVKFIRGRIPWAIGSTHTPIRSTNQVPHGAVITATESFAVGGPHRRRDIGMPVLIAVVHVGLPMIAEVLLRTVDAIAEASALHVVPCIRRAIPVIAILRESWGLRAGDCRVGARREYKQRCGTSDHACDAKPIEIHLANSPFIVGTPP
jgi:hypothetical protein